MNELLAKWSLKRHTPQVILFCGTWGKSLSVAAASLLLRKAERSVDYTFQTENAARSIAGGGRERSMLFSLFALLFPRSKHDLLLIEMHGKNGLSSELIGKMERPIVVIPWITNAQIEASGSLKNYLQSVCFLTKKTAKELCVIYNRDISGMAEYMDEIEAKEQISFSINAPDADIRAESISWKFADDAHLTQDHRVQGMVCKVRNGGSMLPFRLHGCGSLAQIYAVLSALSLAKALGMNLVESLPAVRDYASLPGRWKLIPGIKKTLLIDDTYAIDPESALYTFEQASAIELEAGKRRIAVISDMDELGNDSELLHCQLGTALAAMSYDAIVGIGERTADLLRSAEEAGMNRDHLLHYLDVAEAGKYIQHELKPGDLVVIKGSKSMRLERIVKELMAFPLRAKEDLLQR